MQRLEQLAVNTIRFLAVDGVQKANSGHPGMPMGMADCAYVLWTKFLNYNPQDPQWINRDRFVLSAGHGSMLLYAMLHLAGYDLSLNDLRQFRQWQSKTPGHPEYRHVPGVETTTGPLGQGLSNGVGMALAMKILADRFNTPEHPVFNHHVYAIVSDGDLMEGISSEAASIAGHLGLGNIIYIYDDNSITIEGNTELAFSEDVPGRFESYGWHTVKIDGRDHEAIAQAIQSGINEKEKPTLICAKTIIGYGSPNQAGTSGVHGAPLGEEEVIAAKKNMGFPSESSFYIPDEVREIFCKRKDQLKPVYDEWTVLYKDWQISNPEKFELWRSMKDRNIPEDLEEKLVAALPEKPMATRGLGGKILNLAVTLVPSIIGGSADLSPSTKTNIVNQSSIKKGDYSGMNLHFGIREHAMGSILNGMALYGGLIPYGSTFLVFSDYMRPAIRLASIMNQQVIYVFTHDSIFVGEDGPTHQPVEHAAALRVIPGVTVFRPADGLETAMAWAFALRKKNGPTALLLTRQTVPVLNRDSDFNPEIIQKGGYVIARENQDNPDVILVASGSEVSIAVEAKTILEGQGKCVRVVSMPSPETFWQQDQAYQDSVIPGHIPVALIEAGVEQGWHKLTRAPFLFIGMRSYGASGPYKVLAEKYGFTGSAVAEMAACWLKEL
ncbi:transketolase [bacterium]|nr:transketolase [bacterium]